MKAEVRTTSLKEVRKQSLIPGVIYGKSISPEAIQVEKKEFLDTYAKYGTSIPFPVSIGKKKHTVYIKNVQKNVLKEDDFINFDLHCITKNEVVTSHVPVILHGKEQLEKNNLYVQQILSSIECEYTPDDAIAQFEFDVKDMKENETVHVRDIPVSKKVTIVDHLDQIVFLIKESKRMEPTVKTAEETSSEPVSTETK